MSLETHIASSDDRLLDGLHFGGRNTASYIDERRNCSFPPQSGGVFSPDRLRLLRFNLADQSGFLGGSTVRLGITLRNTSSTVEMKPVTATPASLFRRVRIIASGSAELEDIDNYGRVVEMFNILLPSQRRFNDITEGWGPDLGTFQIAARQPRRPP